jgi:hypothetical protein
LRLQECTPRTSEVPWTLSTVLTTLHQGTANRIRRM